MKATHYHQGRHLSLEQLYDATAFCPVCLADGPRMAVCKIQQHPQIQMLRCNVCAACSASMMPTRTALDEYYAGYYRGLKSKVTMAEPFRFARHIVRLMPELWNKAELRILDFGGGDGSLARAVIRCAGERAKTRVGGVVELVDYQAPGHFEDEDTVVNGHHDLGAIAGPFDVILASAILEHVPAVHEVIMRLAALAGPSTAMYARTPYVLPLAKLVPGFDFTFPAHVHDMGSSFWNRFVKTFGLKAEIVRSAPSVVETSLVQSPFRTIAAHLLKSPAHLERLAFGKDRRTLWNFVGGWEVVIRFK